MDAPDRAPADRRDVFDLFELLQGVPGVFFNSLLPALEPRHHAALALTCRAMRVAVQHNASKLTLLGNKCCLSREHQLGAHFPNLRTVVLKPGNLHEAMFVVPLFLMQAAQHMTRLTSLQLQDLLPDRPNEDGQCGSCAAFTSTYDLSAILATAAHCLPHLAALDFTTHYISDAECAAIALMKGLTQLQLRSTHGTHVDGISRFTALRSLANISLSDRGNSSRLAPEDLCMLLSSSSLTSLSLGPHSLTAPLLNCLAHMNSAEWAVGSGPPRPTGAQSTAAAAAAAAAAGRGRDSAAAADALARRAVADADPVFSNLSDWPLLAPPPLASLSVALGWRPAFERAFSSVCCLTGLTRLHLGWIPGGMDPHGALEFNPSWPLSTQQQLSNLHKLQDLALGWALHPDVLAALADISSLTCLQLGGLFSALPGAPPVGQLRLPAIKRLTVQMETPIAVLQAAVDPTDAEPLMYSSCVAALAAFPGLTRLELAGRMYGHALAHLPHVLPREDLLELLLPQRLSATTFELSQLKQLRGLTYLRLGWRCMHHAGPAGYLPASSPLSLGRDDMGLSVKSLTEKCFRSDTVIDLIDGSLPADLLREAAAAAISVEEAAAIWAAVVAGDVPVTSTGVEGTAGSPSAAAAAAGAAAAGAGGNSCGVCGASPLSGCLCKLHYLEVVGPLPLRELRHLQALPSLRHLTLRDNASWASGLPMSDLAALTSQLTLLELFRCDRVDGTLLEWEGLAAATAAQAAAAAAAAAAAGAAPPAAGASAVAAAGACSGKYEGCRVVVTPRAGITAAELGRGHQFMGVVLLPCEELGTMPDEIPAREHLRSSEDLPPDPAPQAAAQQQQQHDPLQPGQQQQGGQGVVVIQGGPGGVQVQHLHGGGPPGLRPPMAMPPPVLPAWLQGGVIGPGGPRPPLPPHPAGQQLQLLLQQQLNMQQMQHQGGVRPPAAHHQLMQQHQAIQHHHQVAHHQQQALQQLQAHLGQLQAHVQAQAGQGVGRGQGQGGPGAGAQVINLPGGGVMMMQGPGGPGAGGQVIQLAGGGVVMMQGRGAGHQVIQIGGGGMQHVGIGIGAGGQVQVQAGGAQGQFDLDEDEVDDVPDVIVIDDDGAD